MSWRIALILPIAGAAPSAVPITAAFAQPDSNDGSVLTGKRYLPEYKKYGRGHCASTARGRTLQLKVDPGVTIGRHARAGEVHAYKLSGSRQLDTGEMAGPGACVYEPAGHVDSWSCIRDGPCIVQITKTGLFTYLGANDELLDYSDTPKLRELYLAWCGESGFEPIAIGAAA